MTLKNFQIISLPKQPTTSLSFRPKIKISLQEINQKIITPNRKKREQIAFVTSVLFEILL